MSRINSGNSHEIKDSLKGLSNGRGSEVFGIPVCNTVFEYLQESVPDFEKQLTVGMFFPKGLPGFDFEESPAFGDFI